MVLTAKDKPVKLSDKTKKRLNAIKIHPRQSYDEVINKLLDGREKK
jgi:hypothetical protein